MTQPPAFQHDRVVRIAVRYGLACLRYGQGNDRAMWWTRAWFDLLLRERRL